MDVDEAQYDFDKWTGVITMKIEKFSEFAQEGEDASRLSDPIYVRGLPWKILAKPRKCGRGSQAYRSLAYFLQCNAEDKESKWSCHASIELKLLAQKEGKEDHVRTIEHTFNAEENDWGFAQFMSFDSLMDPENGWYDETTDSIILSIEFNADMPYGIKMKYGMCEDMDMGNLFDQRDQYSDSVLVSSDGTKFKVYKGILACRSPVFAAMFRNNEMIEAQNGIVQIEDIRSEVLEQLLRFMYGKKQPNMEENIAQELLSAADKYELVKLKIFCECNLAIALNVENACELLVLADQHSAKYLQANAIKFIQKNAKKVRQTEGWKMLVKGKYAELLDQIMEAIVAKEN